MGLFSEELRILDENTVKLMIDEMQDELDEQRAEIEQQNAALAEKDRMLQEAMQRIAELEENSAIQSKIP